MQMYENKFSITFLCLVPAKVYDIIFLVFLQLVESVWTQFIMKLENFKKNIKKPGILLFMMMILYQNKFLTF